MAAAERKDFKSPDEVRTFEKGKAQLLNMNGGVVGRFTLEPGWRWSQHVKPIAGTEWCEAPHFQYHVSGRLHVVMSDGTTFEAGPGDVTMLPRGTRRLGRWGRAGGRDRLVGGHQLRQEVGLASAQRVVAEQAPQ